MELTPYIEHLSEELAASAEAAGEDARAIAERLLAPLESGVRLAMLAVLSAAAAEITQELAPGSVDLRLRGLEPSFVITPAPLPVSAGETRPASETWRVVAEAEDAAMTRINLRLSQELKDRVEDAARAAALSVNAWLVRSAVRALGPGDNGPTPQRRHATGGDRFSGWVH